jgi:pimeloyl-ACP methyl ester carboxylesterase
VRPVPGSGATAGTLNPAGLAPLRGSAVALRPDRKIFVPWTAVCCALFVNEHYHTLPDGRRLCYARFGERAAQPLLYFHGTPSSRLEPLLLNAFGKDLEALLRAAGLQLIAIDRPGMGGSDYHKGDRYGNFAADMATLCADLGFRRLPVLCWSGGGPYALRAAHDHPGLIASVHIICGFTRTFDAEVLQQMGRSKYYFQSARFTPFLLAPAFHFLRHYTPKQLPPRQFSGLPWADYYLLDRPETLGPMVRLTLQEAARQGALGPIMEARAYYKPYGHRLRDISQPVHYWWGTHDMAVIRAHAESIEQEAPRAFMHYRPGEGHLSLYVNCFEEILAEVVRATTYAADQRSG